MAGKTETPTNQPSNVATEEAVKPDDSHVSTDDRNFFGVPSADSDSKGKPAASDKNKKSDQTTDNSAASDDKSKPAPDKKSERRIKQLTRKLSRQDTAHAEEVAALKAEIEDLKKSPPAVKPEPKLEDFSNPQEYAKAYNQWEADKAPPPKRPSKPGTADQTPTPKQDAEVVEFQTRGKEKYGDAFVQALNAKGVYVDADMGEFLVDSDNGSEIYIYLANHPEESKEIFDSSKRDKFKTMEALEEKAAAGELITPEGQLVIEGKDDDDDDNTDDKSGDTPPKKKTAKRGGSETNAGEPPSDTKDAGNANLQKNPEDESMDEYAARRRKETARAAGYNV